MSSSYQYFPLPASNGGAGEGTFAGKSTINRLASRRPLLVGVFLAFLCFLSGFWVDRAFFSNGGYDSFAAEAAWREQMMQAQGPPPLPPAPASPPPGHMPPSVNLPPPPLPPPSSPLADVSITYTSTNTAASANGDDIPNLVHFVRQLNRDKKTNAPGPLKFEFRHFLAYYSAHMHLKPDRITIWSDATPDIIERARVEGDEYTKAVLRIPNLHLEYVEMPNATATGTKIELYAHKSDFVRTRVMAEHGGMYFDDDAWVLKDLAPLRKAGFDNVFGRQWGNDICQAFWMAKPKNDLMQAWSRLQETQFNGDWVRASNELISRLVYDFSHYGHGRNALILEQDAFFPGMWHAGADGLQMFYKVHNKPDGKPEPMGATPTSVDEAVSSYIHDRDWGWRRDWRLTYVIHGFSNAVRAEKAEWMFDQYKSFTPRYVLARKANIARALYPALQDALRSGILQISL